MPYLTTADLSARLGAAVYARLTDRVNGTTADPVVAQQIIDEAAGEADSYLCRRYATPIDLGARPELRDALLRHTLDLAEYLAWCGSPFIADLPGRVRSLAADARRWFEQVATGVLHLPAAAPPAPSVAVDDGPRCKATPRAFTHDELNGL